VSETALGQRSSPSWILLAIGLAAGCVGRTEASPRARGPKPAATGAADAATKATLTVAILELSPSLRLEYWTSTFRNGGLGFDSKPSRAGEVHRIVDRLDVVPNVQTAPLTRGTGLIEYMITDKAKPEARWQFTSNDYECTRGGRLRVEIRATPAGDRWVDFQPKYSGQGCRAPLNPICCSEAPYAPGQQ
jgi:hypothetical protein